MPIYQAVAAIVLTASVSASVLVQINLPALHREFDNVAAHLGQPLVVVVVDARRLGTVQRWARDLLARYPKLGLVTVADVNEKQPVSVERVGSVLARRVPPEAKVMIDMQRRWAEGLGLDTSAPNLLLLDTGGEIVAQFRGRWNEALAAEVASALAGMGVKP